MESVQTPPFRLGRWEIQPSLNQVADGEQVIRLAPKFMHVLLCLAERAGDVVTREELLDAVWPEATVHEAVLTQAISQLRKALDDDGHGVIETIPKTGYRLVLPVTRLRATAAAPPHPPKKPTQRPPRLPQPARPAWGLILLLVFLVGSAGAWFWWSTPAPTRVPAFSQTRPLTSLPGNEFDPVFSPNGQHLAFAWHQNDETVDLYVKDIATDAMTQLTHGGAYHTAPAWAPDGQTLAYVRCAEDGAALFTRPATGGTAQKLLDVGPYTCQRFSRLAWSPDGTWMAYAEQVAPAAPERLVLFSLEHADARTLTAPEATYQGDRDPTFSPDGQQLAFLRIEAGDLMRDLYVVPVLGGAERRITDGTFRIEGFDWAPDGSHLIFSSRGTLWKIPVAGGVPQWMATASSDLLRLTTSRQKARLAYVESTIDVNIWRLALTGTHEPASPEQPASPERLVASTRIDAAPSLSPDGRRLAYLSERSGDCGLWIQDEDAPAPIKLTTLDRACVWGTVPRWAPDGNNLVFATNQRGNSDLYMVSTIGGPLRPLTETPHDEVMPRWSPDGEAIYFASNRGGSWQLWTMPAAGGAPRQVTQRGGFIAQAHPTESALYFTKQGQPGLWHIPTTGGQEEQVLNTLHPDDAANWRIVADGLYYLQRTPAPALYLYDLSTQQSRHVADLPTSSYPFLQMDVGVEGRSLLFTRAERGQHDIMMVEPIR